jgi:hypothetical protein
VLLVNAAAKTAIAATINRPRMSAAENVLIAAANGFWSCLLIPAAKFIIPPYAPDKYLLTLLIGAATIEAMLDARLHARHFAIAAAQSLIDALKELVY